MRKDKNMKVNKVYNRQVTESKTANKYEKTLISLITREIRLKQ